MKGFVWGLVFGYLVSGVTLEASGVATVVTWDGSECPAGDARIVTTASPMDGQGLPVQDTRTVTLPLAVITVPLSFDAKPHVVTAQVFHSNGQTYQSQTQMLVGDLSLPPPIETPTPTPTPTPGQQSPEGTKAVTITDATGRVWTLGPNGETLRDGIHVGGGLGSIYKYLAGNVFVMGAGETRWYVFDVSAWKLVGTEPGIPIPQGPQVQTAIELKLDQIISLLQQPTPPVTVDCAVTAFNSASVTIRCTRANFPSAVVGTVVKVVK
jgi:hypothetical protein